MVQSIKRSINTLNVFLEAASVWRRDRAWTKAGAKKMNEQLEFVVRAAAIGTGATAVMDLWGLFLKRTLAIPPLDYAWVGRWIGHFPRGRFAHANIAQAPRIRGETPIGWVAHYAIGIVFAALLMGLWGLDGIMGPRLGTRPDIASRPCPRHVHCRRPVLHNAASLWSRNCGLEDAQSEHRASARPHDSSVLRGRAVRRCVAFRTPVPGLIDRCRLSRHNPKFLKMREQARNSKARHCRPAFGHPPLACTPPHLPL